MADKNISGLTAAGALTGTELVAITQSGNSRKATAQAIANLGGGGYASRHLFAFGSDQFTNANSTSFVQMGIGQFAIDLDVFPFTQFRLSGYLGSNAPPASITVMIGTASGTPANSGAADLVLASAVDYVQGSWITRNDGLTGKQTYKIFEKGSNNTVDLTYRFMDIEFRL